MKARDKILAFLATCDRPVPLHEMSMPGVSQTSASARLREMARDNIVESVRVPGRKYTCWILTPKELVLPL